MKIFIERLKFNYMISNYKFRFSEKPKAKVFYKKVSIVPVEDTLSTTFNTSNSINQCNNNWYKIKLDNKFLKSRHLQDMKIKNLPLAYLLAQEWISQKTFINNYEMHVNMNYSNGLKLSHDKEQLIKTIERISHFYISDQLSFISEKEFLRVSKYYKLNLPLKAFKIRDFIKEFADITFKIRVTKELDFNLNTNENNNFKNKDNEIISDSNSIDNIIDTLNKRNKFVIIDSDDEESSFSNEYSNNSDECLIKLKKVLEKVDPFVISLLEELCSLTKSFGISIGIISNKIDDTEAYLLSHCEEIYQMIKHGEVEGHHDILKSTVLAKLNSAIVYNKLLMLNNK